MMMVMRYMNFYKWLNSKKKQIFSIGIIFFLILISNNALTKDVIYESDDYKLHAVRVANYYLALKQGQLPVRWGPNLNGGYGYPSFNYMYHTPYIVGSAIHSTGFSVQESLNISVLFSLLFGGISCYFFVKSYLKSEIWSILLAVSFIINPYTLLNVYWRGAVGELYFYAFVPIFLLATKKLLKSYNLFYFLLLIFATSLLILSHLPSILLLGMLVVFFIIAELKVIRINNLLRIIFPVTLGFLLTAWYWIPAYFELWMVKYQNTTSLTQFGSQFISSISVFDIRKNIFSSDFFVPVLQIGGVSILAIIVGLYLLKYSKKSLNLILLIFLSLFLSSGLSEIIWQLVKPLQYIQFPWRFLWLITIASIFILIQFFSEKKIAETWKTVVAILVALGILFSAQAYIAIKGGGTRSDFDWYHPTFETGSSFNEHLPIWANMIYHFPDELVYITNDNVGILAPLNRTELIHKLSDLNVKVIKLDGGSISYEINTNQDIVVLHKRLFFPGWEAYINQEKTEINIGIPEYNGIIAISVPSGSSIVDLKFTGYTKLRKISEIISIFTAGFIIGHLIYKKYKIRKT